VLGGAFKENQFHPHFKLASSIDIAERVPIETSQNPTASESLLSTHQASPSEACLSNDGVGAFVSEYVAVPVISQELCTVNLEENTDRDRWTLL